MAHGSRFTVAVAVAAAVPRLPGCRLPKRLSVTVCRVTVYGVELRFTVNGREREEVRVWQDVRYGMRAMRSAPWFSAAAVLTLSIGIGGTVALFSVVNGVLLRPLDYPN